MPEIKHYKVTQVREVYVDTINAEDAVRIAAAAFKNGQNTRGGVINGPDAVWGNTTSRIEEVSIFAEKKKLGER